MYLTGFADEASPSFEMQVKATRALGWKNIEARHLYGGNLASITDEQFEELQRLLAENDVKINCYGSAIANWSHPITEEAESSYEEFRKAIPRMQKLGTKMVRIMSFAVPNERKPQSWDFKDEVVKRVTNIVKMAEDAGILCLHENCMNWGGLSYEHTLYLLDHIKSDAFRLVFDTGNPVFNLDWSKNGAGEKMQSSWEYYKNVREFISYIHIKDGTYSQEEKVCYYSFAGKGDGNVKEILADLYKTGYDGGISIEPHVATVFHENENTEDPELQAVRRYDTYISYGKELEALVREAGFRPE